MAVTDSSEQLSYRDEEFVLLVLRYLDRNLTQEELAELEDALKTDTSKRQIFREVCLDSVRLHELGASLSSDSNDTYKKLEQVLGPELQVRSKSRGFMSKPRSWLLLAAAVMLVATTSLFVMHLTVSVGGSVRYAPVFSGDTTKVAMLSDAYGVDGSLMPRYAVGTELQAGTVLSASTGSIELCFRSGAVCVVEAPFELEVEGAGGLRVTEGNVFSHVSEAARGFVVDTPHGKVVDLGTRFGVEVDSKGNTSVAVAEGLVEIQLPGNTELDRILLEKGEVASADINGWRMLSQSEQQRDSIINRFMTTPGVRLSLADMVAGGDGLGDRVGSGIDPVTGDRVNPDTIDHIYLQKPGHYAPVPSNPLIDGVFIPDRNSRQAVIDSDGDTFGNLRLSGSKTFGPFWSGMPRRYVRAPRGEDRMYTELGGVDYASGPHNILFVHPNKGITFDLKAMRRQHKGLAPSRFVAMVGNTEITGITRPIESRYRCFAADLWVLVDGVVVYERLDFARKDGMETIDVPISTDARFLTIVASQGRDGTAMDWVALADAYIHVSDAKRWYVEQVEKGEGESN